MSKFKDYLASFYDENFSLHRLAYAFQSVLAFIIVFVALTFYQGVESSIIIASLGSTAFILFVIPHHRLSSTRYLIGSYIIACVVGASLSLIAESNFFNAHAYLLDFYDALFGALAVAISMFLMVVLNLEHPPATGVALGLVTYGWTLRIMTATLIAVTMMIVFRWLFRRRLINLL